MYRIHLGIPEMEELWNRLEEKHRTGSANKNDEKLDIISLGSVRTESMGIIP